MKTRLYFVLILSILLTACGGSAAQDAPAAVQSYLEALIAQDSDALVAASCGDWEAQARLELASFTGVTGVELNDVACLESGQDGDVRLVSCTGQISASYGAENLVIELAERTYQVVEEGGEWRMCGYR